MGKHFDAGSLSRGRTLELWRRPRTWLRNGIVGICFLGTAYLLRHHIRQQAQFFINIALVRHNAAELDQFVSANGGKTAPPLPAAVLAAGPLRVASANPRYFADGTGKLVYLTGSHKWANFQDNGNGNPPTPFDYAQYLDFLTANNHNFFRLWTWGQSCWMLETSDDNYWFSPQGPYVRSSGQGNALDGQPNWDLSQFYCLANPVGPGAEFIVFQPSGADSFTVDLRGLSGSFAMEWLNPETDTKSAGAAVNGGDTVTFDPPFANAVLYLKQQSTLAIHDSPTVSYGRTGLFAGTRESYQ